MEDRARRIRLAAGWAAGWPQMVGLAGLLVPLGVLLMVPLGGCRSRTSPIAGTDLGARDTLQGRLVPGRQAQAFTFEGVESSVLDFQLASDEASFASPNVAMVDPEGQAVDLAPYIQSAPGAATMQARGVVLLRTGTYQVTVTPAQPCTDVYYRFSHCLQFPPMERLPVTLTASQEYPVYVTAPRGGMVTVQVTPKQEGGVTPEFRAVKDPWGGRALDPTRKPDWAPAATVTTGRDGSVFLNFTAPIPGRYTVVAAAKDGTGGPVFVSTRVQPAPGPSRSVYHPNRPADAYGLPAAGSSSDGTR